MEHHRILRAGLETHCILKAYSSSEKILTETQRSLGNTHPGMYSVLYVTTVKAELKLLKCSQTTKLLKVWSTKM